MSYIIGISGTHGVGKSTLINGLKEQGVSINEMSISRMAQKKFGYSTLTEAHSDPIKSFQFQQELLNLMYIRDYFIKFDGNHKNINFVVVERTPLDLIAYAYLWDSKLGYNKKELETYVQTCINYLQNYYSGVINLHPHENIKFEPDPNRGSLEYRYYIEEKINEYINDKIDFIDINSSDNITRISQFLAFRNELKEKIKVENEEIEQTLTSILKRIM